MFVSLKGIDAFLNSLPVVNTVNGLIQGACRLQWEASITESKASEASSFKRNFQILVLNKSAGDLFFDALPLIGNIVALVKWVIALINGFENDLEKAVAQNNRDVVLLCLENGDLHTSPNPEETLKNAALLIDNQTFQRILEKREWSADYLFNALNSENLPAENVNSIFEYRDFSKEKLEPPTVLHSFLKALPDDTFQDFIHPLLIHKTPGKLLALIKGGIATKDLRLIRTIFLNATDDGEFSAVLYPFLKALPDKTFHKFIRRLLVHKTPGKLLALIKGGIATEDLRLIRTTFLSAPYDVQFSVVLYPFLKALSDETFQDFIRPLLIDKKPGKLLDLIKGGIASKDARLVETIFVNMSDDDEFSAVFYSLLRVLKDETFQDFIRPFLIHKTPGKLLALIKGGIAAQDLRLIKTIFNACPNVEISLEEGRKIAKLAARSRAYDFITTQLHSHPIFQRQPRLHLQQSAKKNPNALKTGPLTPNSQTPSSTAPRPPENFKIHVRSSGSLDESFQEALKMHLNRSNEPTLLSKCESGLKFN